jgi:alkylated DNA nucleotide flippase Atl1
MIFIIKIAIAPFFLTKRYRGSSQMPWHRKMEAELGFQETAMLGLRRRQALEIESVLQISKTCIYCIIYIVYGISLSYNYCIYI